MCNKHNNELLNKKENEYINIQTGEKLDLNRVSQLKENAMLKNYPELWIDWDFEKNDELGCDVWKVTKGSNKKGWWICSKCTSSYDSTITNRRMGTKCPYCSGRRVNHTNSLASLYPILASQWHPTLNGDLTPHDIIKGSETKVWWTCDHGHYWCAPPKDRSEIEYCSVCMNRTIIEGVNDLNTSHPHMTDMLVDKTIAFKYHYGSTFKTDWKCPTCKKIIKNKEIRVIINHGIPCPNCSNGFSKPERIMSNVLNSLGVEFEYQKAFSWSNKRIYDFYMEIDEVSIILEINGEQHSRKSFGHIAGARTLVEEQENDKYKYELAIQNGIQEYITIDCGISRFDYIKNSIMESSLKRFFKLEDINWTLVHEKSVNSMIFEVCKVYDDNPNFTIKDISKVLNISYDTVFKYLNIGEELNITTYRNKGERNNQSSITKRKVVQLENQKVLKIWDSITEASIALGLKSSSSIRKACVEYNNRTAKGFHWMYLEDYEKIIDK